MVNKIHIEELECSPAVIRCETEYCTSDGKVAYRWRWLGGKPPIDHKWLYVCESCHVTLLESTLEDAKTELDYKQCVNN